MDSNFVTGRSLCQFGHSLVTSLPVWVHDSGIKNQKSSVESLCCEELTWVGGRRRQKLRYKKKNWSAFPSDKTFIIGKNSVHIFMIAALSPGWSTWVEEPCDNRIPQLFPAWWSCVWMGVCVWRWGTVTWVSAQIVRAACFPEASLLAIFPRADQSHEHYKWKFIVVLEIMARIWAVM